MAYRSSLPRSVYILGDGLLFDEIIAHMLASVINLRVIRRAYDGEAAFLTELNECRPDVILLAETDLFSSEQVLELLSQLPLAADLRIIVMSMHHKDVQILDRLAAQKNTLSGVSYLRRGIDEWSELFELVTGKQL